MAQAGGRDPSKLPEALDAARAAIAPALERRSRRRAVLALDYGSARCGVALSDPTGTLATPLEPVLAARDAARAWRGSSGSCASSGVERVVVGLPLGLSGDDTGADRGDARVRRAARERLGARARSSSTTSASRRGMAERVRRRGRRGLARRRAPARGLARGEPERLGRRRRGVGRLLQRPPAGDGVRRPTAATRRTIAAVRHPGASTNVPACPGRRRSGDVAVSDQVAPSACRRARPAPTSSARREQRRDQDAGGQEQQRQRHRGRGQTTGARPPAEAARRGGACRASRPAPWTRAVDEPARRARAGPEPEQDAVEPGWPSRRRTR